MSGAVHTSSRARRYMAALRPPEPSSAADVAYDGEGVLPQGAATPGETGERGLWSKVLSDGCAEYLVSKVGSTEWCWVESRANAWAGDFERLCDVFGLDAGAVRARLREDRRQLIEKRYESGAPPIAAVA